MSRRWAKQWDRRGNDPFGRREFNNPWFRQGTRLGVNASKASPVLDAQLGLRGRGVVISSVVGKSIAAKLGLQRYDILLELNGVAIRQNQDVATALRTAGLDDRLGIFKRAPPARLAAPGLHIACAGIDWHRGAELARQSVRKGRFPEPLRLAHMIGQAMVLGRSKGRP